MKFNQCQKDIILYIIEYGKNPEKVLIPCIEVLAEKLKDRYTNAEIEENTRTLVSNGILTTYSFHNYLGLTETFITSRDYKLFKDKKI